MDKRIDVKAATGAVQSNTILQSVPDATIQIHGGSEVRIFAAQADIASMQRAGDDLIVKYADGTVIRLAGYFAFPVDAIPALLLDDKNAADGIEHVYKAAFDPLALSSAGETSGAPLAVAWTPVTGDSGNVDSDEHNRGGMLPWVLGGLAVVGAGVGIAAASGGSSHGASSNTGGTDGTDGTTSGASGSAGAVGSSGVGAGGGATSDTTAPDAPLIAAVSQNGSVVTLTGTAEANSAVNVFDGNTLIGTAVTDANGTWTFTTPTLSAGQRVFTATATDAAGNVSLSSTPHDVTIALAVPALDQVVNDNASSHVVIAANGLTNDNTPTLSGTAVPNVTITLFDGGKIIGTTTTNADGTWQITAPTLIDGEHQLSITATDGAGNVSAAMPVFVVTVDTTAPDAPYDIALDNDNGSANVSIADGGATIDNTPVISGRAEEGTFITIYNGDHILISTFADSDGQWSIRLPKLDDGTYALTVTATDAAGFISAVSNTYTVTVDTTAPSASTLSISNDNGTTPVDIASGGLTNDSTPLLSGTAEVGSTVKIYQGEGDSPIDTVLVGTDGKWSYTPTTALIDGTYTYSVTATDAAGNVSNATTSTLTVDATPPAVVSNLAINAAGTAVSGFGEPGAIVTVRDADGNLLGTAPVNDDRSWSVSLSSAQTTGATLSVAQTDSARNMSPSASVLGVINVAATNDLGEVDYTTRQTAHSNALTSANINTVFNTTLLSSLSSSNALTSDNSYQFSVGTGDTRSVTFAGSSVGGGQIGAIYTLYLFAQQANGSWAIVQTYARYAKGALTATQTAIITLPSLGAGTYALAVASDTSAKLPKVIMATNVDTTTQTLTLAATAIGNLLANDTSSVAGTVPTGTAVTAISGVAVAASGDTSITTAYGTLVVHADGSYTYTLKAGTNIGTLPANDTFTYSVTDANGLVTSATLSVTLHNGVSTSLVSTHSLFAIAASDSEASLSSSDTSLAVADTGASTAASTTDTPVATVVPAAPTSATITDELGSTNHDTQVLNGMAVAGSTLYIFDGANLLGSTTADATGQWRYTVLALSDGEHTLYVSEVSAAGDIGAVTSFIVSVDTAAPAAPDSIVAADSVSAVSLASHDTTADSTPTLSGHAEAGATVEVFDANHLIGTANAGADGTWHYTTDALKDGEHAFSFEAVDSAGNTSALSSLFYLTVAAGLTSGLSVASASGAESASVTTSSTTASQTVDSVTWHFLTGTDGNDTLYGTDGSDYINGGAGVDSLYGGLGDDLLVFNANDTIIDGGAGNNTLLIEDAIAAILGATTPVTNVGTIQLADDGTAHSLTLDATGADKAAGTGTQLTINGTAKDDVTLTGATDNGHVLVNSQTYESYTLGHTTVLIEEPIQVHVTPA